MRHVVITRMLYREDEPFFQRLELYKAYTLKSLREQTNQNFDIAVLCSKQHAHIFRKMDIIPFFTRSDYFGEFSQETKTWHVKVPWGEIEGLREYEIQTNLDSDDFVSSDYIEAVQELSHGDKSIHIHFQPTLVDIKTGEHKKMRNRYDDKTGSAFYSLYQPNPQEYIYIGIDGHRKMQQYADKTVFIGEGYAFVGIHDHNDSTTINS